jgi:hypothetical protein
MQILIFFIIFLICLFFYIHVNHHLQVSNLNDVYEIDNGTSKEKLENILNLRQPVIIHTDYSEWLNILDKSATDLSQCMVNIRNVSSSSNPLYAPLNYSKSKELMAKDEEKIYYSEQNRDLLEQTKITNILSKNDNYFRPPLQYSKEYDLLFGSENTCTPLKYNLNHRNFYFISSDSCTLFLASPKNYDNLEIVEDYYNNEFRSEIKVDKSREKIDFIEINLTLGQVINIPPYWFFSFKFNKNTQIISLKYETYMSTISHFHINLMQLLQKQNTTHVSTKKHVSFSDLDTIFEIPKE